MKMENLLILTLLSLSVSWATIPRPRGVSISMASFYAPAEKFRCLDSSLTIPYEYINDDYCDCQDGSDEPGTPACANGRFHCTNAGYKPLGIKSSRVNDGVCDCCDGTDEYSGTIECVNTCKELGKKMREDLQQMRLLQEEGNKKKLEQMAEGKKTKEEKTSMLEELDMGRNDLESARNELEEKKNNVENPEREAKDRHKQIWDEVKAKREAVEEKQRIEQSFHELDVNNDNMIDVEEIRAHLEFDINTDGEVSEDEAKEHLEDVEKADAIHFAEHVWPHIKDLYKKEDIPDINKTPKVPKMLAEQEEEDYEDEDSEDEDEEEEYEDDDEDAQDHEEHDDHVPTDSEEASPNLHEEQKKGDEEMPEYDEETKKLIETADAARSEFEEADRKLKDAEKEINDIKSYLAIDYGSDEEFSVLKDQCYDYTDREYTYKLCPFDRTSQRPKGGGSETRLGSWGHWDGPESNKYTAQKYDKGQNCWNGPDRSVRVDMSCGLENKITNTYEPSRCEYVFEFSTPALCTPVSTKSEDTHDEL